MTELPGQPFVYSLKHKMLDEQSTADTIPNHGVTKLTALSTYTLDAPVKGTVKTIYRAASLSTAPSVVLAGSGRSFNSLGGTQTLTMYPTTAGAGQDVSVTLIGESSTQWRVMSAWPGVTASATVNGVIFST
jgi:hypothetical protein